MNKARVLFLGVSLVLFGQGLSGQELYAEEKQGPNDFHMGPVPNEHQEADKQEHIARGRGRGSPGRGAPHRGPDRGHPGGPR